MASAEDKYISDDGPELKHIDETYTLVWLPSCNFQFPDETINDKIKTAIANVKEDTRMIIKEKKEINIKDALGEPMSIKIDPNIIDYTELHWTVSDAIKLSLT